MVIRLIIVIGLVALVIYVISHYRHRRVPQAAQVKSRHQAYAILELEEGASPVAIEAAYKRLIRTAHPDNGGSDVDAARINAARDLLLK